MCVVDVNERWQMDGITFKVHIVNLLQERHEKKVLYVRIIASHFTPKRKENERKGGKKETKKGKFLVVSFFFLFPFLFARRPPIHPFFCQPTSSYAPLMRGLGACKRRPSQRERERREKEEEEEKKDLSSSPSFL